MFVYIFVLFRLGAKFSTDSPACVDELLSLYFVEIGALMQSLIISNSFILLTLMRGTSDLITGQNFFGI